MSGRTALRHRLAERGIDRQLLLLAPAAAFVAVLFIYPFLYGVGLSLQPARGGPLGAYRQFFADPYQRDTVLTTLGLALPAALLNVAASVPIAYRMRGHRSGWRSRGKRLLTTVLVVPITLGTVLTAQGLLNFLGPTGWFNRILLATGLVDAPLRLTNNYWGVFFSLVITGFPFAFLLVLSYLSGIDPTLERAAATLGAGGAQRFRRITLPLLAPGLATTFCLTFVLAFSVFPSAVLVGDPAGQTRVISIAAYDAAYVRYDYPMAAAIAVIMGVVELAVIAAVLGWRSLLYTGSTSGGKG
ncbi:carbohydrate ABC transporter membrane protein 1, CUT1 family [Micromonospora pattaloongensis]|uniref:Carbohydrate ABC transporter membrane protein 1, CUT1 family n=1 Tax=Micromonospora pattaloongensis TaxID=405436 RepID=A0A1H3QVY9_9ACTN|nr:ABC transporter permease subunit [Micromonospora pattaloongensis]SDZ17423.1 carbohydrate ABC transporter membrane protein 1, CUT1 family [Micromonospora pattaloongensis]